nr:sulfotransferase [uncultured Pseudodesulfovibrio sp.]
MNTCAPTFVVSTGRCATTLLGLLLGEADTTLVLNEGQIRDALCQGPQVLKALTLENRIAYEEPDLAVDILREKRQPQIAQLAKERGLTHYVEIAYYLCPFVAALQEVFPDSKIVYVHRDGRDFVRSAYVNEVPDPMPVGYTDPRPLDATEKFVAMGRLAPLPGSLQAAQWDTYTPFEKNVWLWMETNRIIMEGLRSWPEASVMTIAMKNMLTPEGLMDVANFMNIHTPLQRTEALLKRKINSRNSRILTHWSTWDTEHRDAFKRLGQGMLQTLGYEANENWQVAQCCS